MDRVFIKEWYIFFTNFCYSKKKNRHSIYTLQRRLPQSKYSIKLFINCSSLECWHNWNINCTRDPIWLPDDLRTATMKLPSPELKPDNQLGSWILAPQTLGLSTGIISGKAAFSSDERPFINRSFNRDYFV
jgi:hypothetical protein